VRIGLGTFRFVAGARRIKFFALWPINLPWRQYKDKYVLVLEGSLSGCSTEATVTSIVDNRFSILKVNAQDYDVRRRGYILAIVILGIAASLTALAAMNIVRGQHEFNLPNGISLALILGLFMINRLGHVTVASILTAMLVIAGAVVFLSEEDLAQTFIILCIPVFIVSFLVVPWGGIVVSVAVISGIVIFGNASVSYLSLFVLASVTVIVYLISRSLDSALRENRYRALHDDLTGLPNRALFADRLQQAIDRSTRDQNLRAVLFMDLDSFKVVNDSLGHRSGDELLITVARRLQACLRPGDTAARLGGDEFTVLLDGISDIGDAIRVSERIAGALEEPIELGLRQVFISMSAGIALMEDGSRRPDTLLRNADVAMYEAKKEGKAGCKVFNSGMYTKALRRLEMENDLRRAIERGELRVYYQPKVLLSTGKIIGMEALVRWEHPERGLVLPDEFIPLAEETGLIVPLGQWVLRETCRQVREWQEQYPTASSLATSVNLSVKQFREPNLVRNLKEILREHGLDPRCLQLEITESVVAYDVEYAVGLLRELKGLGVQLAIDDFGTGYSSLVSLQRFPLDDLKIDRGFVAGLREHSQDEAIAGLVIDLAHALGMRAIAEGVETMEQLARLRGMRCDQGQGSYFWKPLTSEAVTALLADSQYWLSDRHPLAERSRNPGTFLKDPRYSGPE
jgi:diguanylate cyclase (GGDEF)-like protein